MPSFRALVRDLISRLPSSSSAQRELLEELAGAVARRIAVLDNSRVAPNVVAERPWSSGGAHPREDDPTPAPPDPLAAAQPAPPPPQRRVDRLPHGHVAHIVGQRYASDPRRRVAPWNDPRSLPALAAHLSNKPTAVAAVNGVLFFTDGGSLRLLSDGNVRSFVGTGIAGDQLDGASSEARFTCCRSVSYDPHTPRLLVVDGSLIRAVALDGTTTTLIRRTTTVPSVGMDGPLATATFRQPRIVLAAPDGSIFVVDGHSIRMISNDETVTTIAGSKHPGGEDGRGGRARFGYLTSMALASSDVLILVDRYPGIDRLRRVDLTTFDVTTIPHGFGRMTGLTTDSHGMFYVQDEGGLHEMHGIDGVASLLAPVTDFRTELEFGGCHLDELNRVIYTTTNQEIFSVQVHTARERRAGRVFPLVAPWALAQRDRAGIAHAVGGAGDDEEATRALFARIMRLPGAGAFGLVLSFAF